MKKLALLSAVIALGMPSLAMAQTPAPAPPGGNPPYGPPGGQFGAGMQQMQQMRAQERTQMLNALTPAHRSLLAQVVGNLAIAPTPNLDDAARQLDAALSANEKQAIVAARDAMRAQMRNSMNPNGGPMPGSPMPGAPVPPSGAATPGPGDPGRILLMTVLPGPQRGAPPFGRTMRVPL
ncbi:MAG: hypothetical protein ABR591_14210 [Candidatus Velthaea sp.]